PAVRRGEGLAPPPSYDLGLVAVVEAFEHHVHAWFTALSAHLQGVLDRADAPVYGLAVLGQLCQVGLERFDLGGGRLGGVEDCGDVGQWHTRVTEQEDALQASDRVGTVVAVAVGPDAVGLEQPDAVIVAQRAAADACAFSELVHRPFHHRAPVDRRAAQCAASVVRPSRGSAMRRISDAGVRTFWAAVAPVASRYSRTSRAPAA